MLCGSKLTVGIHQPNYAPWLGYFAKMAAADVFVFLDDVQFSKNSFINRVQIATPNGKPSWLTVPVSFRFGDRISEVRPANDTWPQRHLAILCDRYRRAPHYDETASWLTDIFQALPPGDLAAVNLMLIETIARKLGIACQFRRSSEFKTDGATSDDRLISILQQIGGNVRYLSGKGGANYQDPAKFEKNGIELEYTRFQHPVYTQGGGDFVPGLSILDALFYRGPAAADYFRHV